MDKRVVGSMLFAVGAIGVVVAVVKLSILGYYEEELVPFAAVGLVGGGLSWLGSRVYLSAREES